MNFIKKKLLADCLLLIALLLFGLFCSKGLFKEYGFATHDGDHHISRSFDAIQSLKEGHFPLRWAGSLNGWCGAPVFNFFYPLIYYLVFLVNFLVKDVINSLKIVASLSFVVAPAFFYLWLNKETKNKIAAFVGAFLYLFVPYRFLLVFVRFSPEFMAYTILPIVLWLLAILIDVLRIEKRISKKSWLTAFVLSATGGIFIISHNFAVLLLLPIIITCTALRIWKEKIFEREKLVLLFLVFVSIVGLSSFFWGPMMIEKKFVKLDTMQTMDYRDHFPTLTQLIRSKWDYGNSLLGTDKDGMSFMLGYSQWLVLGFSFLFILNIVIKKLSLRVRYSLTKQSPSRLPRDVPSGTSLAMTYEIIFWFALSCISIFLILPWSNFAWERIKILQQIQFSWRFLGVTSFTIASLAGFLLSEIKNKKLFYLLALIFLAIAFYGNRNHLRIQPTPYPQKYIDYEKNHDHRYATTSIFDDILNKESAMLCMPSYEMAVYFAPPLKDIVLKTQRANTFGKVSISSKYDSQTGMHLSLEYFPGIYKIKINNQDLGNPKNCQGRICFESVRLHKGENVLEWKIVQSSIEKIFNYISLGFLLMWALLFILISFFKVSL